MNHANVLIPVRGTGIARLARNTTAKTGHGQIAVRMVPKKNKRNQQRHCRAAALLFLKGIGLGFNIFRILNPRHE
jgi:hypothetical protein